MFFITKIASVMLLLHILVVLAEYDYQLGELTIRLEKTTFPAPSDFCPPSFSIGVLAVINYHRGRKLMAPITLDSKSTFAAQAWASGNRDDGVWEKNNLEQFGQLVWKKSNFDSQTEISVGFWNMFNTPGTEGVMWGDDPNPSFTGSESRRKFTPDEWKETKTLGLGCSCYKHPSRDKETVFFVTAFFVHPKFAELQNQLVVQPLVRFNSKSTHCPLMLKAYLINVLNNQRAKKNLLKLNESDDVNDDATKLAQKLADGLKSDLESFNKYGFFSWTRIFDSPLETTLSISANAPFAESWGESATPIFKKDAIPRFFTENEWASAKHVGVGCVVFHKIEKNPKVKLQIVMLTRDRS